jgi:hypothetical protein
MKAALILAACLLALPAFAEESADVRPMETASPAQERAQQLQATVEKFELNLWPSLRQVEKPFYSLTLTVAPVPGEDRSNPFVRRVQITKEQAGKIIDHLAASGLLGAAAVLDPRALTKRAFREGYALTLPLAEVRTFENRLGWNLKMLERLDALRTVLDGDAAKAMDLLLGRMSGLRQQWQKERQQ